MPRFEPFRATRYAPGTDLTAVTSPPYDVLSDAEIAELARRDEHNIVHIDDPLVLHAAAGNPYAAAAGVLSDWLADGTLVVDEVPTFTIHRMRFTDHAGAERETVGVLGALEVGPYGESGVLPHERITPKASTDRLDLTRATRANMSPVWGLALGPGLTAALREPAEPVATVELDGVTHTLERVTDPARQQAIEDAVAHDDVLIADGHHRYGVAQSVLAEAASGDSPGAQLTLAYIAELAPDQLNVAAIHRIYRDTDPAALTAALTEHFELTSGPEPVAATLTEMAGRDAMVLITRADDGVQTHWLTSRGGALDDVRAIDGARLEHALAGTGITPAYQHGVAEVVELVLTDDSRLTSAVLINPVSLGEILRTGREGLLMPPKSTFFTPKLPTGFVIRGLDD